MTLDIPDEDVPLFIRALEHYHAYLVATQRADSRLTEYADKLKRKRPEPETGRNIAANGKTATRRR